MQEQIERFIERFRGAEDTFLHGCCYWFALILQERFFLSGASGIRIDILHEPVEGHFVTMIGNRIYDVRGDVTELYKGCVFESMSHLYLEDYDRYKHLMRDCRDFLPAEDYDGKDT